MHFLKIVLVGAAMTAAGPAPTATVEQAQAAYGLYDVNTAERLYRDIATDQGAGAKDRAIANRELARIAWLVDGDRAGAVDLLAQSLKTDPIPVRRPCFWEGS